MIDFSKGNEGRFFGGYFGGNIFGAMVRKNPPGRARPLVLLCHGQGTFQTPSLLTYVHLPEFDFINPDSHLLGKNCKILHFCENPVTTFCRFWKILQNEYLIVKIGVDTAENGRRKEWCVVASSKRIKALEEWIVGAAGPASSGEAGFLF